MAETPGISDADIDALLAEMNQSEPAIAVAPASSSSAKAGSAISMTGEASQDEIDALLSAASFDDPATPAAKSPASSRPPAAAGAPAFEFPDLQRGSVDGPVSGIELLRDVELNVKIELGRSKMLVEDVLKLGEGAVVELDKLAGDPVDVYVNERLVARGEVLVLNDQFCVRVNEIISVNREDLG